MLNKIMDTTEIEKLKAHVTADIINYVPDSVVIKTILKKPSGNISIMSFDKGEGLAEKTMPFDTFVQIIEGRANIIIDEESNLLQTGHSIIIPAHASSMVKPDGQFKMILTTLKSGYE